MGHSRINNDDSRWKENAERHEAPAMNAADRQTHGKAKRVHSQGAEEQVPEEFALRTPYPNPSSGLVTIPLALPERAQVSAAVYDVLGRPVRTLAANRTLAQRNEMLEFSAGGVSNGVYLIRVSVEARSGETHTFTEKVTVMR